MSQVLIFLCFLVLFSFPLKSAEKLFPDTLDILTKLEGFEIKEDDDGDAELELLDLATWKSQPAEKIIVNVDSFGAIGDGVADDTQAFVDAWNQSCTTPNAVLLVPNGSSYLVNAIKFNGPCEPKFIVQIDGKIVAPSDPHTWDSKSPLTWLVFNNLTSFIIQGDGVIDGNGDLWWSNSCKRNKSNPCGSAPMAFTIRSSSDVEMSGLKVQNGQQMNIVIKNSESVILNNVTVSAPATSPNTDGIHLTHSTNVVIRNCSIGTGDDCISIVSGSSNITMLNISCGPGHGISIGSLGQNNATGKVENVVLDTAHLNGTTNGLRIKTYQGGDGYAKSIRFQNVQMDNVSNPIIINQFYCDSKKICPIQPSAVQISEIMYYNVTGNSPTKEVMNFACSDTFPCTNIVLHNISLQNNDGTAETYCHSAYGTTDGPVQPPADCLLTYNKGKIIVREDVTRIIQIGAEHVVHTEL